MTVPAPLLMEAMRIVQEARAAHPDRLIWLYAIQAGDEGPIKLGVTRSPADRLRTLQQGNAATLHGIAAWRGFPLEEKQLHEDFTAARLRGEWFAPTTELLDLVRTLGGDFEDWS